MVNRSKSLTSAIHVALAILSDNLFISTGHWIPKGWSSSDCKTTIFYTNFWNNYFFIITCIIKTSVHLMYLLVPKHLIPLCILIDGIPSIGFPSIGLLTLNQKVISIRTILVTVKINSKSVLTQD